MKDTLISSLQTSLMDLGVKNPTIKIEYPEDHSFGDYSTNVAMMYGKQLGMSPRDLATKIVEKFNTVKPKEVISVDIAGPGFINFKVSNSYFAESVVKMGMEGIDLSSGKKSGKNILIEHTDPNAFKAFHIGHLMANAIGESLSRLVSIDGSKVTKICYPSDIGLHIAKSIWAMKKHANDIPSEDKDIITKTSFLGKMYVEGTQQYDIDQNAKIEIDEINKKIYDGSDEELNRLYNMGKKWSLDHYELLYKRLGTKFDGYIFESEASPIGKEVVLNEKKKGIFQDSDGAVVFKGEDFGLHTRVFLNSVGLTTYEAKEIGLNITKFKRYPDTDESIIITASEQNDYFKVIKKVLTLIDENIGNKTKHIGHGMMRFASGKMSSRTGNVITAESLISEIKDMVMTKIKDKDFTVEEKEKLADMISIGAIKYTILRQSIGSDIIFDSSASISFEGDSGPYLQYSTVRAGAIIKKAKESGIKTTGGNIIARIFKNNKIILPEDVTHFEKLLGRFDDVCNRARNEYAPQLIANYLTILAGEFNSFYAKKTIVDKNEPLSPYYVKVTKVFRETMEKGLWLLGISVPDRM